jgi:hypothetical protein
MTRYYDQRLVSVSGRGEEQDIASSQNYFRYLDLSRRLLDVERRTTLRLRAEGKNHRRSIARELERELDLSETQFIRPMPAA